MTTTSQDVKEIQNRHAAGRARVIAATDGPLQGQSVDAAPLIEAAMMGLAAVWREEADWWEKSGKRGAVGTAKELRAAAGRLAGFAVGLTSHRNDGSAEVHEPQCRCNRPECVALSPGTTVETLPVGTQIEVGGIGFTKIGKDPFGGTSDDVMNFLTGKTDKYEPKTEQESVTAMLKPPSATQLIDNPFTSPGPPGANRAPVAAVPYASLHALAAAVPAREHVSHSYVTTYESCSLSAMLRDASTAGKIGASRPGWSLLGGNAFHRAVEFVEQAVLAGDATVAQISDEDLPTFWQAFLDGEIKDRMASLTGSPYADPSTWYTANGGREGFDWWRVEGAAMLKRYLTHHDAAWREQHAVLMIGDAVPCIEFPYSMSVRSLIDESGIEAQGFIDIAWLDLNTYQVQINDYKTGKSTPTDTFQLGEYGHALLLAMGLPEAPPGRPLLGSYWLARKGEYTTPVDVIASHPLVELQFRYGQAMRGTRAGVFGPHLTNLCVSCGVHDYCPAQTR